MTEDDICGEQNADGTECKRDAGWGRGEDVNSGPCMDHVDDYHNPKKLTPETKSTLVGAAQEGAFKQHCAQVAGITEQTLRNWLNWGEADVENDVDSPCADLFLDFQRARGAGAVRRLKDVRSEFVLERSYDYTKTEERQITGDGGGPLEITFSEEVVTTAWSDENNDETDGDGTGDTE